MRTIPITLPIPHKSQQLLKETATRFNVVDCGRRWGKTILGQDIAMDTAIRGYPVGWFAPEYKYLVEVWQNVVRTLHPIISRKNTTEKRIELITGGHIEFWSIRSDADAGRSRKYKMVIVDEAAKIKNLEQAWNEAIRPTLTDFAGGAWFLSTPKGRNFFWDLHNRGLDPLNTEWSSWVFPTVDNPYIEESEVEAARLELPEMVFKQEYLAEFLENEGLVFRNVFTATIAKMTGRPQDHSHGQIYFGVDWGKQNDFTVIFGVCNECKEVVLFDRFNQIDYAFQVQRLQAHVDRWKPTGILPERNSMGEPIIEQMQRLGMPIINGTDMKPGFFTTSQNKPKLIEDLALAIETGELKIPNNPVLINELLAFERVATEGRPKYRASTGAHDDTVMSLAITWRAVLGGGFSLGSI